MRIKGTGKWHLKIIEYLHGTTHRYTPAALRMCLDVRHGAVENALLGYWRSGLSRPTRGNPAMRIARHIYRRRPMCLRCGGVRQ